MIWPLCWGSRPNKLFQRPPRATDKWIWYTAFTIFSFTLILFSDNMLAMHRDFLNIPKKILKDFLSIHFFSGVYNRTKSNPIEQQSFDWVRLSNIMAHLFSCEFDYRTNRTKSSVMKLNPIRFFSESISDHFLTSKPRLSNHNQP